MKREHTRFCLSDALTGHDNARNISDDPFGSLYTRSFAHAPVSKP